LNVCRSCPVRRECIIHAYKGGPGRTPITGRYMGGFSLGQRKAMTLEQALTRAEAISVSTWRWSREGPQVR
jgi:hypothetical protein